MDRAGYKRLCSGGPLLLLLLLMISEGWLVVGGKGGFLEEVLPLEPVVSVPEGLLAGKEGTVEAVNITGAQVLTIIFSRPVISTLTALNGDESQQDIFLLDPEVPGKTTWITSHIVQFRPHDEWPYDHNITFQWGQDIQSYDGIPLQLKGKLSDGVNLMTPSLTVKISKVVCKRCSQWTDNGWLASIGLPTDNLPEVPPGGEVYLEFSHPVSPVEIERHLKVLEEEQPDDVIDLGMRVGRCEDGSDHHSTECRSGRNCENEETSCILVKFWRAPETNTRYRLELEEGTKYSKHSGGLLKTVNATFGGLRTFRIPFVTSDSEVFSVRSPQLTMWLPHGLSQETRVEDLKSAISLTEIEGGKIKYSLLVERSTVNLIAELKPQTTYKLEVRRSSSVLDGFGQELQASSLTFETEPIKADFRPLEPRAQKMSIFEAHQDWGRNLMVMDNGNLSESYGEFCDKDPIVCAWNISSESELTSLAVLQSRSAQQSLSDVLDQGCALNLSRKFELKDKGRFLEKDVSGIIAKSGVIATEHCRSVLYDHHLIVETDLQVAIIAWGSRGATAWITKMKNAEPVRNASVRFYRSPSDKLQNQLLGPDQFEIIFEGRSNEVGVVELEQNLTASMHAVVEYKNKLIYIPNLTWSESKERSVQDAMHLDKKLLRPGETLHIIGFVVQEEKGILVPASKLQAPTLTISPPFNSSSTPIVKTLDVNSQGVFEMEVNIPKDARPAVYTAQLEATEVLGSFEKFTVQNNYPFIPILEAEAPFWTTPDSKVFVGITTRSSAGTAISQAVLNVSCTVIGDEDDLREKTMAHNRLVTTDENGTVSVEFDLKTFVPRPFAGYLVVTTITWESSSDVFASKKIATRLEYADAVTSIERSVETELPGQLFGVRVFASTLKGRNLTHPAIVFMKEIPRGLLTVNPVSDAPLQGNIIKQCNVITGDMRYKCRLMLPKMGVFVIEVCMEVSKAKEEEKKTVCRRMSLGKTEEDWNARPLDTHNKVGLVSITREPHQRTGVSVFGLDNPYKNCRALVIWGNSIKKKHKVIVLKDQSFSAFRLLLGKECLGNCTLSVAVSVPRQQPSNFPPNFSVPTSNLFDPLMPHIQEISLNMKVQQVQLQDAKIELSRPEESEVPKPGKTLMLRVSVPKSWKPVRVLVVGTKVDTAKMSALAEVKEDLDSVGSKLTLDLAGDFVTTSSSHLLLAPQTLRVLKKIYLERRMLDPWTSVIADEFGVGAEEHTVDLSRSEYLNLIRKPVTVIPSNIKPEPKSYEHSSGFVLDGGPPDVSSEASEQDSSSYISVGPLTPKSLIMKKLVKYGNKTFNFSLPDEQGTYLFRAYAAADEELKNNQTLLRFGSGELLVDVFASCAVYVKSPRFVRVGDIFDTAVEIVPKNLSPEQSRALLMQTVQVIPSSPLLEVVGNKSIEADLNHYFEAHFSLKAIGVGKGDFEVVFDGVGVEQTQRASLDILELQEASRYFEHKNIEDGRTSKLLPRSIDQPLEHLYSEKLDVYLGVGGLPAFLSFVKEFNDRMPNKDCPALVEVAFSSVLLYFIGEDFLVNGMSEDHLEDSTVRALSAISENLDPALEILETMTSGSLGLDLIAPCQGSSSGPAHKMARIELSAKVAMLHRLLNVTNGLLREPHSEFVVEKAKRLTPLAGKWTNALELMVTMELRNEQTELNLGIQAVASAGMGFNMTQVISQHPDYSGKFSLSKLFESEDAESLAYSLLSCFSSEDKQSCLPFKDGENSTRNYFDSSFQLLMSTIQEGPSVAYLSEKNKPAIPASYIANALALLLCSTAPFTKNVDVDLAKSSCSMSQALANFVANPPLGRIGLEELSDFDRTVGMLALRMYDKSRGAALLSNVTTVLVTNDTRNEIVQVTLNSTADIASYSIQLDEHSALNTYEVSTEGSGAVAVAVLLTTNFKLPYPNPLYQGIFVERAIHSLQSTEPVGVIPLGSMVKIVLQLTAAADLPGTTIQVSMPGGLEVMHITGKGQKTFKPCAGRVLDLDELACANQDTRSSVVTFTVERMRRGTHSIYFYALAAYLGEFFFPPVKAFVRTRPIEAGLSESGKIIICSQAAENCGFVAKNHTDAPEKCLQNCSHNGACNLKTGKCWCRQGFNGPGCSTFEAW